jgi:hypothetical protein
MAVRNRGDGNLKRVKVDEELHRRMAKIVEHFNSQDNGVRLQAIDAWAEAVTNNPENPQALEFLPNVVRHLGDTNTQVMGAALDAWKAAAKANPGEEKVLAYLPAIIERMDDPDELVRYAATSAVETVTKANPGHPAIEEAKARRAAKNR